MKSWMVGAALLGVLSGIVLANEQTAEDQAFLGALRFAQDQQRPPEQYPGQRDHAAPPAEWFCSGARVLAMPFLVIFALFVQPVQLSVYPSVGSAPATFRWRAMIERHAENRQLCVSSAIAEGRVMRSQGGLSMASFATRTDALAAVDRCLMAGLQADIIDPALADKEYVR